MSTSQLLNQVLNQAVGATFFRADLHIHTHGGSHDVRDISMTPTAIVTTAIQEKLSLIAITATTKLQTFKTQLLRRAVPAFVSYPAWNYQQRRGICFAIYHLSRPYAHSMAV